MSKSPVDTGHPFDKRDLAVNPHPTGELARRVAATLASTHAAFFAAELARCVRDVAQYEASVRGGPTGVLSAGRMMIERASPDVLDAIAYALDVVLPPVVTRWLQLAQLEGVPLIAGWDLRGGTSAGGLHPPQGSGGRVRSAGTSAGPVRRRLRAAGGGLHPPQGSTLRRAPPSAGLHPPQGSTLRRAPEDGSGGRVRRTGPEDGSGGRVRSADGSGRCVKLYVNASDAAGAARARLRAALTPDVTGEPPAVMGMNVTAAGIVETKLYVQSADAVTLADGFGVAAQALAATARDEHADAGGVVSFDAAGDTLHPRAFFVALREPPDATGWRCVRSLPGYDPRAVAALLPFAPAPPRSVGISLHDGAWTVYCKPHDSGRAPEALEPTAIFRVGDLEVGVFVEPTEYAARAFRRTARHAVSVRVRAGTPAPRALEVLVDWFTARLRTAELEGAGVVKDLADPPAPWRLVNATQPFGDLGERP